MAIIKQKFIIIFLQTHDHHFYKNENKELSFLLHFVPYRKYFAYIFAPLNL